MTERRLNEMNDASPRFAEVQTGAPLLSSIEEGAVSLTELTSRVLKKSFVLGTSQNKAESKVAQS